MNEHDVDDEHRSRDVFVFGEMTKSKIRDIIATIRDLQHEDEDAPITMFINTDGGNTEDMFALYDFMQMCSCPIHTIGIGEVASAGILILAAGTKGHRQLSPSTTVMTHKIKITIDDNTSIDGAEALISVWKRQERMWINTMTTLTGQQREIIEQLNNTREDVYISPHDCIMLGIVDRLTYEDENAKEPYV